MDWQKQKPFKYLLCSLSMLAHTILTAPLRIVVFNEENCEDFGVNKCNIFQHTHKHNRMCWTKNKIHLIIIGKRLVATSKRLSRLFSYYKRQISFLLWVRVHNSPLINKSFSALLAQKPDYQFRFHGTHFAAPDKRSSN